MTLIFKGYAWYLFAYCHLKEDYRVFRISRIRDIDLTGNVFTRREKTYRYYFSNDEKKQVPGTVSLVLKFSREARIRVEEYFDEESITVIENGDLVVRVAFPLDEWVYSTILSYGEGVEVLEPSFVREKIIERLKKNLKNYQT